MKKIKVKIVKNSFGDGSWYENQIGNTLTVLEIEGSTDLVFWKESGILSWIIRKSDCEVIPDDPTYQDGINEGFEAGMMYDGGNSKLVKITRQEYKMLKENQKYPEATPQPFNLVKALAGGLILSNGDTGKYMFTNIHPDGIKHVFQFSVNGGKDQASMYYSELSGKWYGTFNGREHDYTITMAPKEPEYVEGWVAVYSSGIVNVVYTSREKAESVNNSSAIRKIIFPKP